MIEKGLKIEEPEGKLGILLPGLGAVSTTFIAGVNMVKKGLKKPFGSLTQMGTIRLGKRNENRVPKIKDFIKLANINDLVFGGWDIFSDNCYQSALKSGVLKKEDLETVKEELEVIKPWKAVFDKTYVKKLDGTNVKKAKTNKEK